MNEDYLINWMPIVVTAMIGFFAIIGLFFVARFLSPRKFSAMKETSYECGIPASSYNWSQIQIRYYVFAILFLIFDVEAVFLFPWALVFMESSPLVFYEMIMFIGILFFGIVYGWRKGVLQWR